MSSKTHKCLFYILTLCAYLSPSLMIVSLSSTHWLVSVEKIVPSSSAIRQEAAYNMTAYFGMWTVCISNDVNFTKTCSKLQYTRTVSQKDELVTNILRNQLGVGKIPLIGSIVLMFLSVIMHTYALVKSNLKYLFIISGAIFLFAGLSSLTGIILFISTVIKSLENHLSANADDSDAPFKYNYGLSFILATVSFLLQELNGACNIYWYIGYYRIHHMRKKLNGQVEKELYEMAKKTTTQSQLNSPQSSLNSAKFDKISLKGANGTLISDTLIPQYEYEKTKNINQKQFIPYDKNSNQIQTSNSYQQETQPIDRRNIFKIKSNSNENQYYVTRSKIYDNNSCPHYQIRRKHLQIPVRQLQRHSAVNSDLSSDNQQHQSITKRVKFSSNIETNQISSNESSICQSVSLSPSSSNSSILTLEQSRYQPVTKYSVRHVKIEGPNAVQLKRTLLKRTTSV